MSQIRQLENDDAESEQEQDNIANVISNSNSEDQRSMVSMTREEFQMLLTGIVDRRFGDLLRQNLGPLVSRIVKEQTELAHEKFKASLSQNSASGSNSAEPRSLQLQFLNTLSLPIFSGFLIKAEGSAPIKVAMVDDRTQQVVKFGPEASAKVEIVAVKGDFDGNVRSNWNHEVIRSFIVRQKEGNNSLLVGKVLLTLKEGTGFVGDIRFRHDSSYVRKSELRLLATVVDTFYGITVTGAMTETFVIKDRRDKDGRKRYPPFLRDGVQRLVNIGKTFSARLGEKNIKTVKDFLTQWSLKPQRLRKILENNMSAEKWEATLKHAQTCVRGSGCFLYIHIGTNQKKTGVVFNVVAEVMGLYSESVYNPPDSLSGKEKAYARVLVVSAYEHMEDVHSFEDETSMHAYWESINATCVAPVSLTTPNLLVQSLPYIETSTSYGVPGTSSYNSEGTSFDYNTSCVSNSLTTPSPVVLYNEASTSYGVPGTSSYNSEEALFHYTTSLVHGSSSHLTDVSTDSLPLENANDTSTCQSMFSDAYAQSSVSPSSNLGSESANEILLHEHLFSLPDFPLSEEVLWENEDSGHILDHQNSEEDMQRFLACAAAAAQRRWRMLFSVLKWSFRRRTAAAADVVSERIQAPKRPRIF